MTERPLFEHQERALDLLRASLASGHKHPVLQMPTGGGKCLAADTPVMLYSGRVVSVQEVVVGDLLMGPDSQPRRVLSLARGHEEMFKITPAKGDPYVVNKSHIISLRLTNGAGGKTINPGRRGGWCDNKLFNISVSEYLNASATFKHCAKGWRAPVDFQVASGDHPSLDSYLLGLWLGDGSTGRPEICSGDPEIIAYCHNAADAMGMKISERINSPRSKMLAFCNKTKAWNIKNRFMVSLNALGVANEKRIPAHYKTGAKETRLKVLAGLIDTDGYLDKVYYITLKSEALLDDMVFVARSLGFAAYKTMTPKKCHNNGKIGEYWSCTISGNGIERIPCKVARKKASPRTQKKNVLRVGIKSVVSVGDGEYFGFELDGDGLFLLGDFTVTHNTRVAAEIIGRALAKGNRIAFCVPVLQLIDQCIAEFWREGVRDIGIVQANNKQTDASRAVQVVSAQTLARREFPDASLVLFDEIHRLYNCYIEWMKARPDTIFLGLSATPWTKGLGRHFDDLVAPTTTRELIDTGFLSPFRIFAAAHPDLAAVKTVAGDYHEDQLAQAMNTAPLVGDVVRTWIERAESRPTLVFAVDRAHARHLQQQFLAAGVVAAYQDAYTPDAERKAIAAAFRARHTHVVCNVGTLTTGIDWDVRCIVIARPTQSEMLHVQQIGRALRTAPEKDFALILDHSSNHARLGFVTDIHYSELDSGKPQKKKDAPERHKPGNLGWLEPKPVETIAGDLHEIAAVKPSLLDLGGARIGRAELFGQLKWYAHNRGYKPKWALAQFKNATGHWPSSLISGAQPRPPQEEVRQWIRDAQRRWVEQQRRQA